MRCSKRPFSRRARSGTPTRWRRRRRMRPPRCFRGSMLHTRSGFICPHAGTQAQAQVACLSLRPRGILSCERVPAPPVGQLLPRPACCWPLAEAAERRKRRGGGFRHIQRGRGHDAARHGRAVPVLCVHVRGPARTPTLGASTCAGVVLGALSGASDVAPAPLRPVAWEAPARVVSSPTACCVLPAGSKRCRRSTSGIATGAAAGAGMATPWAACLGLAADPRL